MARDDAALAHNPRKLRESRLGFVDVAQQIRERQRVERAVAKRELFSSAGNELNAAFEATVNDALTPLHEHAFGQIDTDNLSRRSPCQLQGDARRSARHVQDCRRSCGNDVIDHRPAPSPVLAHREHLS